MFVIHYLENQSIVLTLLSSHIPSVDEDVRIKGRKGKIISIKEINDKHVQVQVLFEKITKNQPISTVDSKKKKKIR
ncbi:hypothetical protein OEV98_14295 [Caldibacillus lycopersici]|uniref:Uncharacterized protein n=1 Tax=Perspicuibacillus lycopersici TaxID=1325689 RepID=A0AAE3LNH3_9BACI|nr:hypothetical protein [Perspicuibacillus lycopersici]MCU9614710.1 hypothetical protein [Perspicuibacillus lycopersici]